EVSMAAYPFDQIEDGRYTWTQFLPCSGFEKGTDFCTDPEAFGGVTKLHRDFIDESGAMAIDDVHFCLDGQLDPATGANAPDSDIWHCNAPSPGILRWSVRVSNEIKAALGL